jgi:hypothetical protein
LYTIEAHTIKKGNDLKAGPGLVKKVGEFIGELKKATITGYWQNLFKLRGIDADKGILLKHETPFQETILGRDLNEH